MATNFSFLQHEFDSLLEAAAEAEQHVFTKPMFSAIVSRKSLEQMVRWVYDNDQDVELPYSTTLSALLFEPSFQNLVPQTYWNNINLIRKIGNNAAHGPGKTDSRKAMAAVKYLFDFGQWMVRLYSRHMTPHLAFDESLIPHAAINDVSKGEIRRLARQYEETAQEELLSASSLNQESVALYPAQGARYAEIKAIKSAKKDIPVPLSISEKETRLIYIDELLREAGWDPEAPNVAEYEVRGMPNSQGLGYVDYVLWGDDGKPLAVVEAKKTLKDPGVGKHQAVLYADCLEAAFGQRPIIFYTNGFETFIWDDGFYPSRMIHGFYTRDELELLINRRHTRRPLASQPVNKDIAGRYYQETAIKRVTEAFEKKRRAALLVMATGSGKTRTAAALVEVLIKTNWAKKILFLADRNALVTQAKGVFNRFLPEMSAIDLTKEEEDTTSRIVFSTYPTMMNRIDVAKTEGQRYYGPGHFDVVIIDEAHRSVYEKYKAIFQYFDALLIGLTATPKDDADKDTYELFGLETGNPTFAYELDDAVRDGFLVPPKAFPLPLKFPREGIKYAELSEEDKAEYEKEFLEKRGEVPDEVSSSAINKWLFNKDTVRKVLDVLMERGLKVEGGDKIGKTIIFAKSHKHAEFIERVFNERYPHGNGQTLQIIDNYIFYAQDLLNRFSETTKDPQIAVSVDMLDTGIDIPDIVNLILFKPVRSKSKFWQMIGRGTRLRPDLFGPGQDKENFCVFDVCGNLEFFSADIKSSGTNEAYSLSRAVFVEKLNLAILLQKAGDTDSSELAVKLVDELHQYVLAMNPETDFRVRMEYRQVEKFKDRARWGQLEQLTVTEIETHISHLYKDESSDEAARRFDLLVLRLQTAILEKSPGQKAYQNQVRSLVSGLKQKMTIPAVKQQEPLIMAMAGDEYWQEISVTALHDHRLRLRELIQFIDPVEKQNLYTNIEDTFTGVVQEMDVPLGLQSLGPYRHRIEKFIREHEAHITIHRIKNNLPITRLELDEVERLILASNKDMTRDDLDRTLGGRPLGEFIRSIIGLDVQAAKAAFSDFLATIPLNADQQTFINKLIDFLTVKGMIDPAMLFDKPFTDLNHDGIAGVFPDGQAKNVINILSRIRENAVLAG